MADPRPDPTTSPNALVLRKFRRGMKWMALLSIAVAAAAVLLVSQGADGTHVHMLIATALGAGLTVLLGTALMMLSFLSASSGHDDQAARQRDKPEEKE